MRVRSGSERLLLFEFAIKASQGGDGVEDPSGVQIVERLGKTDLVADLVRVVADQPDMIVEDVLCGRLGTLLGEAEQAPVDKWVGPHHLAEAMVAAEAAVRAALTATTGQADAWCAPWRVLTALACVLPYPLGEVAGDAIVRLRDTAVEQVLPAAPPGPVVTGPVLWTCDRYGTRFAVAAPITTADRPARWYLWDIDACGHQACLGEVVTQTVPRRGTQPGGGVDAANAAVEFVAWLRARDADQQELPEDVDELVTELADSWCINEIDAVYARCSPHRVALCVRHMRGFYLDKFADQLVALLPEWTRWLAARNATSPELADRCLPYAYGQPHLQVGQDGGEPDYLARVIE